jgi:GH24 family phage-related lysozyme (muramidase)
MKYKATQKDRYGNMKSLEITMDNQLEVPPMTSAVPMYDHPGEPKGTDTVPAWLTPGEFVVNKEATDMYGPLIKKINDEGRKVQDMKPEYAAKGKQLKDWKEELKEREGGYQYKIYDPLPNDGKWEPTIGLGHLLDASKYGPETEGQSVPGFKTKKEIDNQFEKDISIAMNAAKRNIGSKNWKKLSASQQWGLTNMAYQLGQGNQAQFKSMFKAIKEGDFKKAAANAQYNFKKDSPNEIYNETSWYKKTPTRVLDFQKFMVPQDQMPEVPIPKPNINSKDKDSIMEEYRKRGITPGDLNQSMSRNPLSNIKKKASSFAEKVKDFIDPNNIGFKFTKPEKISPFKEGGAVHLDPGGMVYPTLDDQDDIMKLIFESEQLSNKTDDILSSVKVPEDDTTTMSMDMSLPSDNYVESYDPQGLGMPMADPTYMSSYDKMVQDELTGSPAYEIPPVYQQIDPDMYDQETGAELLKVDKPMEVGITKPEVDVLSNLVLEQSPGAIDSQLNMLENNLSTALKDLQTYQSDPDSSPEGETMFRDEIRRLENEIASKKKRQALIDFQEKYKGDMAEIKKQQDLQNNITNLENQVNNPNITETERTAASQALDDLNKQKDTTEVTTPLEESQSKLAAVANNLNTAKEAELKQDLDSDAGKAAQNDANQSQGTPAYEQAKGVLNFLFGDLIDGQELGRGIAIYLASRALGYDHNDTIGYVAKNYLKRVDTKNALMDKFIKENAGKYTKKSLADYKRTGDPNMLTPIGSTPRPQGEEKTYYNAAGQARVAYKFKKKNAQGDDFTYWSWDKDGGDVKQRVSSAWTSDGSDVQGTDEYNEKINKAADRIVGQMKSYKEGTDKTKEKNIDKGIMQNVYTTDIEPEFAAREVAAWADKNGFQVYKMGPGIQQAWKMAIAAADEAEAQGIDVSISSLIPYLEEATIKQRLDNLKDEEGKPLPPVSTAIVNGNKIEMNPSELVILNGKINNVTGDVNRFWNTVAKVYNKNDKESGKPWKKIFEQHVIDSGENITPFALFGQVYLENIMEGMANQ